MFQKNQYFHVSTRKHQVGFTLVELLVVIVIVGLLLVLSIAGIQRVAEKNRAIQCMGNLKQLYTGILSYVNDHGGMLPPGNEIVGREFSLKGSLHWGGTGPTWNEYLLQHYLEKKYSLMVCPSSPVPFTSGRGAYPHYAYNERLAMLSSPPRNEEGAIIRYQMLNGIESPSTKILLADCTRWQNGVGIGGIYNINDAINIHPRHHGKVAQIVFVDGHIESLPVVPEGTPYPPSFERVKFVAKD